jgi:hypothetical protein
VALLRAPLPFFPPAWLVVFLLEALVELLML